MFYSYLIDEIEHLHQQSLEHDSDDDDDEPLVSQALHSRQERLEAEKEILDAHNRRLNEQLERLRRLMQAHVSMAFICTFPVILYSPLLPLRL